jgi:hypothetical protein
VPYPNPKPDPQLKRLQIRNRNRNKSVRFHNTGSSAVNADPVEVSLFYFRGSGTVQILRKTNMITKENCTGMYFCISGALKKCSCHIVFSGLQSTDTEALPKPTFTTGLRGYKGTGRGYENPVTRGPTQRREGPG